MNLEQRQGRGMHSNPYSNPWRVQARRPDFAARCVVGHLPDDIEVSDFQVLMYVSEYNRQELNMAPPLLGRRTQAVARCVVGPAPVLPSLDM